MVVPGAVRLQPGGRPARLGAAGYRDCLAARPAARADPAAAAARRADAGADLRRRRRRRRSRACSTETRLRRVAADGAGSAGRRRASASARTTADCFRSRRIDPLNVVGDRGRGRPGARSPAAARRASPTICSSMTARSPSARSAPLTLSSLAPRRGELLWDIGAGSGSVAIEWMLADPSLRAVGDRGARRARRAHPAQRRRLRRARLDRRRRARARRPSRGSAAPDAVFIGGGGERSRRARRGHRALAPGGRLVANAVTLETEALLLARHAALGGELTRIAVVARRRRSAHDRLAAGHAGDAMARG